MGFISQCALNQCPVSKQETNKYPIGNKIFLETGNRKQDVTIISTDFEGIWMNNGVLFIFE